METSLLLHLLSKDNIEEKPANISEIKIKVIKYKNLLEAQIKEVQFPDTFEVIQNNLFSNKPRREVPRKRFCGFKNKDMEHRNNVLLSLVNNTDYRNFMTIKNAFLHSFQKISCSYYFVLGTRNNIFFITGHCYPFYFVKMSFQNTLLSYFQKTSHSYYFII